MGYYIKADLKCPGCGQVVYETNPNFRKNKRPTCGMFTMKEPYKTHYNLHTFPSDPDCSNSADLFCPYCECPYSLNGAPVVLVNEQKPKKANAKKRVNTKRPVRQQVEPAQPAA